MVHSGRIGAQIIIIIVKPKKMRMKIKLECSGASSWQLAGVGGSPGGSFGPCNIGKPPELPVHFDATFYFYRKILKIKN